MALLFKLSSSSSSIIFDLNQAASKTFSSTWFHMSGLYQISLSFSYISFYLLRDPIRNFWTRVWCRECCYCFNVLIVVMPQETNTDCGRFRLHGLGGCFNLLSQQVSFSPCLKHPNMHLAPVQSVWPCAIPNRSLCQTALWSHVKYSPSEKRSSGSGLLAGRLFFSSMDWSSWAA